MCNCVLCAQWLSEPKKAMSTALAQAAWDDADISYADKLLKIGADPNFKAPWHKDKVSSPALFCACGCA